MAAVRNAFDLLAGGAEQPTVLSGKAKKKNKKKSSQPSLVPEGSEAPITAAPVVPAASEPPKLQSAKDAGQALEAAVVATGAGEWGALALQWTDQILHGDTLYSDGSQLVDFKQVLLGSHALELLFDGCLERGTAPADAHGLSQLLAAVAHPAAPPAYTAALVAAVAGLGQACAADQRAPTPAAKRAAAAALVLLRSGVPKPPASKASEPPAAALRRLEAELERQEARLAGLAQPREQAKAYGGLLGLLCAQLDLLRPAGGAADAAVAPGAAAAVRALDELRALLAARLQIAEAPPKPQLSPAEQAAEAEATHRREDAAAAGRLAEVEGRIASLEAELAALKREAGDLRQRRAAAAQHHELRLEAIRSGKLDVGPPPEQVAAALRGGLAALDGLATQLRGGGGASAAAPAADGGALGGALARGEVPAKLAGAVGQALELGLQQLHELGAKARFFRERLEKAIKQGEQAARLGLGDPKTFAKQRATAEANVKEVLAAAEAAAESARSAVAAYRQRLPLMQRLPGFQPPPPEYLAGLEARAAEAGALLAAIRDGSYVAPPAESAPEAPPSARAPLADASSAPGAADVSALEARLAALEAENQRKDAQIAAMVGSSTLEVPSPLVGRTSMPPAMLSSPSNHKPVGPTSPIAPASALPSTVAAPAAEPGPEPATAAPPPVPNGGAATAGVDVPVVTFSQALLQQPAQANGRKPAPRVQRA